MKYFILGSAASAVLLYGSALIYGATGSTEIRSVLKFLQEHPQSLNPIFGLGFALVLFGFLFKVASVPFHMWMPDVYEGAPVPVTGFMTTGLKAAAFATFVRILATMGYGNGISAAIQNHLHDVLWVSCALTMLLGNFIALTQVNLKRMLAYSSIAHTGYLLLGILSGTRSELGFAPGVMYILVYAAMNLGAFVILTLLQLKVIQSSTSTTSPEWRVDTHGLPLQCLFFSFRWPVFLLRRVLQLNTWYFIRPFRPTKSHWL